MRCQNCNSEYEGESCPNCNGLPDTIQNDKSIKKTAKLLGFRTNKIWKKIVSILYLIFCFIYLLAVICTEKYVNITNHDFIISQICDSMIFVIMITPYIFLSNTKFRNILPLFKKHNIGASAIGLIIVTIIIGIISGVIDAAHSEEFLNDRENHAYTETIIEATCEKAGEIKKFCEYCGISETETISVLGHKMEEVSRKDATETADGEIVKKCSVCGKEKKTVLEKMEAENNESKTDKTENNSSNANSSKLTSSKTTSSKTENTTVDLTKYIGKTLQDMSNKLKIDFVEISDNDYFYSNGDNSVIFEIYTSKTGAITAIKLIESNDKYTLLGIKSNTKTENANKPLKSNGFKSIGDNKWVSKSNKDIIMFVGENWVYEKDSPLVSDEALKAKALESFVPEHSDSLYQSYIGNGQIVELLSDSFSKFSYDFSNLTGYQKSEYINKINGRYIQLHGTVSSVDSNGIISVFCEDYRIQANLLVSGAATGNVKLITEQTSLLSSLNEKDEVIIFAKIKADTYDTFLGTEFFDLYDGILYSIGSQKMDIPIIESNTDGIYRYIPTDYSLGFGFGEY